MITWLKKLFEKKHSPDMISKHNVFCLKWFDKELRVHQLAESQEGFHWVPDSWVIETFNAYLMRINMIRDMDKKTYIKLNSKNFLNNDFYSQVYKFKYKHIERIKAERATSPYRCVRAGFTIPQSPTPPSSRVWVDSDLATKKPMDPKYKNALEELNALIGKKRNDSR